MHDLLILGFDPGQTYKQLAHRHPLLFRLHTKPSSPDGHLIAAHFCNTTDIASIPASPEQPVSLDDLHRHICKWSFRDVESAWISTTFSLPYVLWEGFRRNDRKELYVSIIDSRHRLMEDRAETGMEALRRRGSTGNKKDSMSRKASNFTTAFQEVLVYGYVSSDAIVITLPWDHVERALESQYRDALTLAEGFRGYCRNLEGLLLQVEDPVQFSTGQAISLMGTAIKSASTAAELNVWFDSVLTLATSIFLWPYRGWHGWQALPSFDTLPDDLAIAIQQHPVYVGAWTTLFHSNMDTAMILYAALREFDAPGRSRNVGEWTPLRTHAQLANALQASLKLLEDRPKVQRESQSMDIAQHVRTLTPLLGDTVII